MKTASIWIGGIMIYLFMAGLTTALHKQWYPIRACGEKPAVTQPSYQYLSDIRTETDITAYKIQQEQYRTQLKARERWNICHQWWRRQARWMLPLAWPISLPVMVGLNVEQI